MALYKSKYPAFEAFRLPLLKNLDFSEFTKWAELVGFSDYDIEPNGDMLVSTPEGEEYAEPGDWIYQDPEAVFRVMRNEDFEAMFELV